MNILASVLTVVTLGFGATSVYLYSELVAERAANAVAHCPRLAVAGPSSHLAPDARNVGPEQEAPVSPNADSGASDAQIADANVGTEPAAREASVTPAAPTEVTRARAAAALRRLYGGLARELGLPPEQEAQLLQLLIDQQTEQLDTFRKLRGDPAAMSQAMTELRDRNQTELMTALGDKYLPFEDYQKSLGERMQIEQAALQLKAAGVPLKEDQQRKVLDVMVDERERLARPTWTAGMPPDQALAQQREWQDDYDDRVRSRLSGVLSAEQLKQYDVYRNLQAVQRRRQWESLRERAAQSVGRAPGSAM